MTGKAALLGYSRSLLGGAAGCAVVGALLVGLAPIVAYLAWAFGFYLVFVTLFSGKSRVTSENVVIDSGNIVVDGKLELAKGDIASAYLQPQQDQRPVVRVRSRRLGGSVDIRASGEAHGRELLTQLGQDASRAVAKFRVRSGAESRGLRLVLGAATMVVWFLLRVPAFGSAWVFGALGALWAASFLASFLPTTLTVGADGILIDTLWRRRFVSFSAIESIGGSATHADAIVLYLREGKGQIEIRTRPNDNKTVTRGPLEALDTLETETEAEAQAQATAR